MVPKGDLKLIFSILVWTTKWLSCNTLLYRMVEDRAKISLCKMEIILVPKFTFSAENKGSGSLPQAEQILILQVIVLKPMVVKWSWKMSWRGVEATSFDFKHPFTLFTYILKTLKCPAGIAVYWDWDAMAELCCLLGSPSIHIEIQGKKGWSKSVQKAILFLLIMVWFFLFGLFLLLFLLPPAKFPVTLVEWV